MTQSVFAFDLRPENPIIREMNLVRGFVLKDRLEGDEVALQMVQFLIIASYTEDISKMKRWAQSLMDYLDIRYKEQELFLREPLNTLLKFE